MRVWCGEWRAVGVGWVVWHVHWTCWCGGVKMLCDTTCPRGYRMRNKNSANAWFIKKHMTNLFRIQIPLLIARHMLRKAHGLIPKRNGMQDNVLELVDGMARAELARVGMHCEGHCDWAASFWVCVYIYMCMSKGMIGRLLNGWVKMELEFNDAGLWLSRIFSVSCEIAWGCRREAYNSSALRTDLVMSIAIRALLDCYLGTN